MNNKSKKFKLILITAIILIVLIGGYFGIVQLNKSSELSSKYISASLDRSFNNYEEAIKIYEVLGDYKESKTLLIDTKYLYAKQLYENKDFDKALELFNEVIDYEDSKEYIARIPDDKIIYDFQKDYIGTWATSAYVRNIFDGSNIVLQFTYNSKQDSYTRLTKLECNIEGNSLVCPTNDTSDTSPHIFTYDGTYTYWSRGESTFQMTKVSDSTTLLKETQQAKSPQIGMTKDEVRNSTWGSPSKINKTTTALGTKEQWVYSNSRYIYFNENGYVITIQEY